MGVLDTIAARLAASSSLDHLATLVAELGLHALDSPLDDGVRDVLGVAGEVHEARIATGAGALRGLLVSVPTDTPLRETLRRLATRLARHAPHALWLLAAVEDDGSRLGFACWQSDSATPHVVALVVDRRRVVDSDAETLLALAAASGTHDGDADIAIHARWVEVLGRESLTARFYRTLQRMVDELAASARPAPRDDAAATIALLYVSRLLFLAFLEAKGWLDGDRGFLVRGFDRCMASGGSYHQRVLAPLFFGTLNTPFRRRASAARAFGRVPFLNGGLFTPTPLERRHRALRFDDAALGAVCGELLARYRFTASEHSTAWSEAAVDPEMLGRAFESLMAGQERRATGAFYTPPALVAHVSDRALMEALVSPELPADTVAAALAGATLDPTPGARLARRVAALTVLDPACGSGAFLVHVLERLAALRATGGDERQGAERKREMLTRSIFGVDLSPTAVWLCELRLWLACVVDLDERDPLRVPPLPNLDHNIRTGDALAGSAFDSPDDPPGPKLRPRAVLRDRYVRSTGARKQRLGAELEREERRRALAWLDAQLRAATAQRREQLLACRARDLFGERHPPSGTMLVAASELRERVRALRRERRRLADGGALPFAFPVQFADVAARGGFDLVIGNPPWVRLHRIAPSRREALRREYAVYRHAAWEEGAAAAATGRGFAAQVDLASLFAERAVRLAAPGGVIGLILPAKLWRSLAGGGVRRFLSASTQLLAVEDWSEAPQSFDATVYPSVIVARRAREPHVRNERPTAVHVGRHHRTCALSWAVAPGALPLDDSPGSPWLLVPPEVRTAFELLRARGVPLGRSVIGRPRLGVKTGCNEAYLVAGEGEVRGLVPIVGSDGRRGAVDAAHLRPVLRGERLPGWRAEAGTQRIVWPHDARGEALATLPPALASWLAPWRRRLTSRADARGAQRGRWWSLFRVEGADASVARVVWADIGRRPRALVLDVGDAHVPLNSCYVARCPTRDDAFAFAALLNSPLAAAWLHVLAEPARGGYHRYLGWTMALFPLPARWEIARALLAPLGARGHAGSPPDAHELLATTLRAYHLRVAQLRPLLEWEGR